MKPATIPTLAPCAIFAVRYEEPEEDENGVQTESAQEIARVPGLARPRAQDQALILASSASHAIAAFSASYPDAKLLMLEEVQDGAEIIDAR